MTSPQQAVSSGGRVPSGTHAQRVIIRPARGWPSLGLAELWEYRDLVALLVGRETRGRYRQTALGTSWIFVRPLLNMLVLSATFGGLLKVPSEGLPYPLFSMAALLPWGYFTTAVTRAAASLVDNTQVISKVYFPRLIFPLAGTLSGLVDFGASLVVFFAMLFLYRLPLRAEMLWLPAFLLAASFCGLAAGVWLATLSVRYRDVAFAVTFLLQALMYASPVIYPASVVPERLRLLYSLNPMTGVIEGFRWALLGSSPPSPGSFCASLGVTLLLLVAGAFIFRRTERTIVDLL